MGSTNVKGFWAWLRDQYSIENPKRTMGMDTISEQRLSQVHPLLAAKIRTLSDIWISQNPSVILRVTQGLRTWDEQQALYDSGRTTPGPIVTEAPAGYSYHNFGLAVDVVPMVALAPDWDVTHPVWRNIVDTGVSLGLNSGALWR